MANLQLRPTAMMEEAARRYNIRITRSLFKVDNIDQITTDLPTSQLETAHASAIQ